MKIIPRIVVSASLCATLGFSGIITGISVIINDEPITLYEVYKYSEQFKISKKESLDLLVRQKLEDAEIKKFNINANAFEVDQYIEKLANNNGLNTYEFLNMIKSKNIKIDDYKKEIKSKIKQDKLYRRIYSDKLQTIEESEIENFYNSNPDQFQIANNFDLTIYSSADENALKAIQNNPMLQPQNVSILHQSLSANGLDEQLKALLNKTNQGAFTQILNIKNTPTMFYVKEKRDYKTIPFADVKQTIYRVLSQQQEQKTLKDYFEKVKSSASINVVRSPA